MISGLTACGIPQCYEASSWRKRFDCFAQHLTTDPVDDDVYAIAACNTPYSVSQLFHGGIDDLIESECLRLVCFRMIGRARYGVFCSQSARQLCHSIADRSLDRWRENGFAWTKPSQGKSHLRGEISDRNTCSAYVVDIVRYQAKIFLPDGNPLSVSSVLKSAIGTPEHHA